MDIVQRKVKISGPRTSSCRELKMIASMFCGCVLGLIPLREGTRWMYSVTNAH